MVPSPEQGGVDEHPIEERLKWKRAGGGQANELRATGAACANRLAQQTYASRTHVACDEEPRVAHIVGHSDCLASRRSAQVKNALTRMRRDSVAYQLRSLVLNEIESG